MKFKGSFQRVSPAEFAEKVGIPLGWFVVNHQHLAGKSNRRKAHGRWFKIRSDRATIYRLLRFSPRLTKGSSQTAGDVVLDWAGWIELYGFEEDVDPPLALKISKVPWWQLPWVYLRHPDPAVRLSGWLGWAGLGLGIMGAAPILKDIFFAAGDFIGNLVVAAANYIISLHIFTA